MYKDIWEILGITPTNDKKKIQQAYAEKVKIYHPEDHPEEFLELQEAYREASRYARNISVDYTEPIELQETQVYAPMKAEETEEIPDYIVEVDSINWQNFYKEDIDKYISILEKKLIGDKSKKDIKEVEELFLDNRFCAVLRIEEFRIRFMETMSLYQVWNQKVLSVLLTHIKQMINESADVGGCLVDLKHYLDTKVREKEAYGLEILFYGTILLAVIFFVILMIIKSDNYALSRILPKEDICQMVYDEYGLIIEPEDINSVEIGREYYLDKVLKDSRIVEYHISYKKDDVAYDFVARYPYKKKKNIDFNLEEILLQQYVADYLGDVSVETDSIYMSSITLFPVIRDASDENDFMRRFAHVLEKYFADPIMKDSDCDVNIQIYAGKGAEILEVCVNRNNWEKKCEKLSEELKSLWTESEGIKNNVE